MNFKDSNQLYVLFFLTLLLGFIKFTIQFYFPILYVELGFDAFQIGFLVSLSFLISLFLSAPVGVLCDKYNLRKITLISLVLLLIFFVGMANSTDLIVLIFLVLIFRTANLIGNSALNNIVLKLKHENINKIIGKYWFFSSIGVALGILAGGYLLSTGSFNNLFYMMSIFLIILIPLSFFLPKTKVSKNKIEDYIFDLKNKKLVLLSSILFIYALHFGAENISYSLFLKNNLLLTFSSMGYYMATAIFVMAIAALFAGKYVNKSNALSVLALSILVSGISHVLMVQSDVLLSLFFRCTHEIGDVFEMVSFFIFFKDVFPTKRIGGSLGAFSTVLIFGSVVGSFLFSYIGFGFGHQYSLIISGIFSIFSAILLYLFFVRDNKLVKN